MIMGGWSGELKPWTSDEDAWLHECRGRGVQGFRGSGGGGEGERCGTLRYSAAWVWDGVGEGLRGGGGDEGGMCDGTRLAACTAVRSAA